MCAGHGVRSPTSSKVQDSRRRVKVTVLAGAFVRFVAFEVPGVSLAFWARGRCRDSGLDTFQKSNGWPQRHVLLF